MLTRSIETSEVVGWGVGGAAVCSPVTCENIRVGDCSNLLYLEGNFKVALVAARAVLICISGLCCNRFWI